jgi:molybdopterin-synthase adenylyltransferase
VLGEPWQTLSCEPNSATLTEDRFDRQARLFGADGQALLRKLHVGVIGAGGGGSLLIEALAHLGVGHLTLVDFDHVDEHNLSRIVGSVPRDARRARRKIDVARRMVRRIDPTIAVSAIDGDLANQGIAAQLTDCDALLVATDTHTSRLVANALACAYLIPTIQIGAKVDLDTRGAVAAIYAVIRPVLPGRPCLYCARAIDPLTLQREAATDEERAAQNYVGTPDIVDPSVITLNAAGAAGALNALLFAAVGLGQPGLWQQRLHEATTGHWQPLRVKKDPDCPWCAATPTSQYARGDAAILPIRPSAGTSAPARTRLSLRWGLRVRAGGLKRPAE